MSGPSGVVVNVLSATDDGIKLLYLRRSGGRFVGQWWPVAGTCMEGENGLSAAIRELAEETGLTPERVYALDKDVRHLDGSSQIDGFVAFVAPGASIELNYEHDAFKWLSFAEAYSFLPAVVHEFIDHLEHRFNPSTMGEQECLWSS